MRLHSKVEVADYIWQYSHFYHYCLVQCENLYREEKGFSCVMTMFNCLENIAKSCIDEENMVIHYDEEKLAKMIKENGLEYVDQPIAGIIYYVALKMGYDFAPEHQDFCSKGRFELKRANKNQPLNIDLKLVKCQPMTDKKMAISIILTVSEDNDRYIEEGKICKVDQYDLIK